MEPEGIHECSTPDSRVGLVDPIHELDKWIFLTVFVIRVDMSNAIRGTVKIQRIGIQRTKKSRA